MQISLRSHLIAGTAAVVGASAIALTPVVAQHEMLPNIQLPSASSAVALAGFDSPITELINTINKVTPFVLSNFTLNPSPTPLSPISKVGLIPQIIYDALPVVRQLGVNGSDYLETTANALVITGQTLSEAVWNFPEAVIDSITSGSLTPIINAILGPIDTIGNALLDAGTYVFTGVLTRAQAVVMGTLDSIPKLFQAVIGQVTSLVNTALYVGESVIGASSIEGAWNAAVNGLFGPGDFSTLQPSIPGALVNLTLGLGQLLDPAEASSPTNPAIPSARALVSGLVQSLKAELATVNPAPPVPTPPPAAAKSVASSAAAARKSVAPSVAAVSSDNGGSTAGGNDGGSKSAAKSSSSDGGSDRGSSKASKH